MFFLVERQHDVLLLRQWSNHLQGDENTQLEYGLIVLFHVPFGLQMITFFGGNPPPTNHISTSEMVRTLRNRMRASASWGLLAAKARFVGFQLNMEHHGTLGLVGMGLLNSFHFQHLSTPQKAIEILWNSDVFERFYVQSLPNFHIGLSKRSGIRLPSHGWPTNFTYGDWSKPMNFQTWGINIH